MIVDRPLYKTAGFMIKVMRYFLRWKGLKKQEAKEYL